MCSVCEARGRTELAALSNEALTVLAQGESDLVRQGRDAMEACAHNAFKPFILRRDELIRKFDRLRKLAVDLVDPPKTKDSNAWSDWDKVRAEYAALSDEIKADLADLPRSLAL